MWSISDLKGRAWNLLRTTYWKSFAVTLVVTIVLFVVNSVFGLLNDLMDALIGVPHAVAEGFFSTAYQRFLGPVFSRIAVLPTLSILWLTALLCSIALSFVSSVLINAPTEVGLHRYFMRARQGYASNEDVLFPFRSRFVNIAAISFLQSLFITLWSLLLFIPGIVKSYEYYMIPYILSENPGISRKQAFALSRAMTDGEKWNIFVLELSFIGWHLLCLLTFGIGELFLAPYIRATRAELYAAMRDKTFYLGKATPVELPGYSNGQGDTAYYQNGFNK